MLYGFDIGGTKIEIAVFDDNDACLWTERIATPKDSYSAFLTSIAELVWQADKRFSTQGSVGIGIPGLINFNADTIYATNIEAIKDKPFLIDLSKLIDRPVHINNDANCFVLSEATHADYQQYQTIFGLILGTGLGGGLVIDQKIIAGHNGCTGEVGHIRLPIDALTILGPDIPLIPCGCGAMGCSERYLSGSGFEWLYAHFYHQQLSAQDIIQLYQQGDHAAQTHVERYIELLAAFLAQLVMIIDMDLIVIGGGLSNFEMLYQQLPQRMTKYLLPTMLVPRIEKAKYGDSGGVRGAALLSIK